MIVLISFNASFSILNIEAELFQFLQNKLINRNTMKANNYPAI